MTSTTMRLVRSMVRPQALVVVLLLLSLTAATVWRGPKSVVSAPLFPAIRFANSYGEHMVLQHGGSGANVWGFAPAGSQVTLTLGTAAAGVIASVQAHAAADGTWDVVLPPQRPSVEEHTMALLGGAVLTGVIWGDVWVCSGQSVSAPPHTHTTRTHHAPHTCTAALVWFLDAKMLAACTPLITPLITPH